MQKVIKVKMGEGVVTKAPHIVTSLGLGSCVVVTLYDFQQGIGGLAHIMLPDSICVNEHNTPYQCADTAISALLKEMNHKGAILQHIVAKIAGGAQMFSSYNDCEKGIGEQNIKRIKLILNKKKIPLIGKDIRGHHGRNIEFYLNSGTVIVKAIGKKDKEI